MTTSIPPHERAANEFRVFAAKNGWLVLSVVVIFNLFALFLYLLADTVYEMRVGIVVGRTFVAGKFRGVERGENVLKRLQSEYEAIGQNDATLRFYKPIHVWDRGRDLIFFVVRGNDRGAMQEFVRKPLMNLLSEHNLIVQRELKAQAAAVQETRIQLDAVKRQIEKLGSSSSLPGDDSREKGEPSEHEEEMLADKAMLESRLRHLRAQMLEDEPTRLLHSSTAVIRISPKLTLYLFLASALGIILGVIGAVVREARSEQMV